MEKNINVEEFIKEIEKKFGKDEYVEEVKTGYDSAVSEIQLIDDVIKRIKTLTDSEEKFNILAHLLRLRQKIYVFIEYTEKSRKA